MSEILFEIIGLIAEIIIDSASNSKNYNGGDSYFAETPYKRTYIDSNKSSADSKYTSQAIKYARPVSSQAFGPTFDDETKGIPFIQDKYEEPDLEVPKIEESKPYQPKEEYTRPAKSTYHKESTNSIKLQILLLYYMFHEDDMKVSLKEKNQIKRHFSRYKGALGEYDIKEIKDFAEKRLSIDTILAFVTERDIVAKEVNTAIEMLGIYNSRGKYTNIINFIKRYLVVENNF